MENTSYEKLQELKDFFYKETGNYPSSATTSIMISNIALQEQIEKLNLLNTTTGSKINEVISPNDKKTKAQSNVQLFFRGFISLIWNIFFISSIIAALFLFIAPQIGFFPNKDTFNTDYRIDNDVEEYHRPIISAKKHEIKSSEIKPFVLEETEYYKLTQNSADSLINIEN